jgi:hypothetical protein
MVIFYRGLGWAVLLIWLLLIVAGAKVSDVLYSDLDFTFILKFAALATAPIFGLGGYFLNKNNPVIIKEFGPTGITEKLEPRHTFYSIRVEYWGIIIPVVTFGGFLYAHFQ